MDGTNGCCGAPQQGEFDEPVDARFDAWSGVGMNSGRRDVGELTGVDCGITRESSGRAEDEQIDRRERIKAP